MMVESTPSPPVKKKSRGAREAAKEAQKRAAAKRAHPYRYKSKNPMKFNITTKRTIILPPHVIDRAMMRAKSLNNTTLFRFGKGCYQEEVDIAHLDIHTYVEQAGKTVPQVMRKIHADVTSANRTKHMNPRIHPSTYATYRHLFIQNQRLRNAFGALARRWIRAKKIRQGNEEDLMTGEVPKRPIILEDFENRWQYSFEPSTILRDMVSRLLLSTATVFPSPKLPRNPYTNTDMTQGQFLSIVQQLRAIGKAHWALEGLHSVQYDIEQFGKDMHFKLRSAIIHNIFSNPSDSSAKELILEFIEDEYENHEEAYDHAVYKWAIENAPDSRHMQEWRKLCYQQHRLPYSATPTKESLEIEEKTKRLCVIPAWLLEKYEKSLVAEDDSNVVLVIDNHQFQYHYHYEFHFDLGDHLDNRFLEAIQIETDD
jgi:hypothetical protein